MFELQSDFEATFEHSMNILNFSLGEPQFSKSNEPLDIFSHTGGAELGHSWLFLTLTLSIVPIVPIICENISV